MQGGTTPSFGTIEAVTRALRQHDAHERRLGRRAEHHEDNDSATTRVHVLIRARGGDFVYSDAELDAMRCDVLAAKRAGAHGVVLGALTRERALDVAALAPLVAAARPEMQVIAGRKAGGWRTA